MTVFAIIVLFAWLFVIQCKQSEITDSLKDIKLQLKQLKSKNKFENEIVEEEQITQEDIALSIVSPSNSVPSSIEDISDETLYSNKVNVSVEDRSYLNHDNDVKETSSFEQLFLGNIFNKIGALAIFVGLIIFIKLVSPFFVFTAGMKLGLGFMLGIALIGGALQINKKENMQKYAEVLLGTGFGALFITTYCGNTVLHVLNTPITFLIASCLLIATFYLADKLKTISMLAIALVAGYLNPFFIKPVLNNFDSNFLFGYLIFVNLLGLIYTYRNKNRNTVNIVNLILTFLFTISTVNNIVGPSILWAVYFVNDLIMNIKSERVDNKFLNYTNLGVYVLFVAHVLKVDYHIGTVLLVVTLFYSFAAAVKKDISRIARHYVHLFLIALGFSIFFYFANEPIYRVYIWSIETVILAYFAMRFNFKSLINWAIGVWTAAAVSTLCIDGVVVATSIKNFVPIFNVRLAAFAPLILSSLVTSKICQKVDDDKIKSMVNIFKIEYLSMIYLYFSFEANDIINKLYIGKRTAAVFLRNMTNVILGFVYTVQLKRLYNSTKFKLFKIASACIGLISLIYLLCAGCNYRPSTAFIPVVNIRVIAFLSAIGASVLYARWTKSIVFKYLAILLGFVLVHTEIKDTIDRFDLLDAEYLLSVGWILYSGVVTALGIFREKDYLKYSGIVLCVLAIIRIFIFDLAHVDILYKFVAFLTLGTILLVLSYYYNKKQK